ncbi:Ecm13p [Saccharomyces eubayanus]|uniref:Ecm13p n=1 Tax=Saccharomyces eubayanus TaxID=1080349 RepID=UPI0006C00DEC|nr:ECM13-like protein [Saccharomyces eubayanus]KOH00799.1 ECM13-like protein [Saccharomyces eubayanus]
MLTNSAHPAIEDQYALASTARSKLARCVSATTRNKDYNLRVLVGHANLLDKITANVEAHNAAVDALSTDLFDKGNDNLSIEHIELSNARRDAGVNEERTDKTDHGNYYDFYSSDEDRDVDTLSSTDSEDDDDYEEYDFDCDSSFGEHNKKIDTYFSSHTTPNYQYLTHTESHSEQADELPDVAPRYNALTATWEESEEEHPHTHSGDEAIRLGHIDLNGSLPIFRVLSRRRTEHDDDSSTSDNESASDIEDGSVPLTRFHSSPITA